MAWSCVVRVTKFDEYNPKAKGKKVQWFRMDSTLFMRRDFASTAHEVKLTWLWMLSQACMSPSREVFIDARVGREVGARTSRQLREAIARLVSLKWIQVLSETDGGASKAPTNERTERTNERTNEDPLVGESNGDADAPPEASASPPPKPQLELLPKPDRPPKKAPVPKPDGQRLIAKYCDLWKMTYRTEGSPVVRPQDAKNLKALLGTVSLARLEVMLQAYFRMPDKWFATKRHDIPTFLNSLNAVTQFAETGRMFSQAELRQLDQDVAYRQTRAEILADIAEQERAEQGNG